MSSRPFCFPRRSPSHRRRGADGFPENIRRPARRLLRPQPRVVARAKEPHRQGSRSAAWRRGLDLVAVGIRQTRSLGGLSRPSRDRPRGPRLHAPVRRPANMLRVSGARGEQATSNVNSHPHVRGLQVHCRPRQERGLAARSDPRKPRARPLADQRSILLRATSQRSNRAPMNPPSSHGVKSGPLPTARHPIGCLRIAR